MRFRPFLLPSSALLLLCASGCGVLSKQSGQPKENPAIAADTEEVFRQRWLEKRTAELVARGTEAAAAAAQAAREFQEKFGFPARKK
jgi:hypothetical protein